MGDSPDRGSGDDWRGRIPEIQELIQATRPHEDARLDIRPPLGEAEVPATALERTRRIEPVAGSGEISYFQKEDRTILDAGRLLDALDRAVDTIFAAVKGAGRGETYIPRVPSARVVDVADALIGSRKVKKVITGIRPGEKVHEILVSEEEGHRTVARGDHYVIRPILPEIAKGGKGKTLDREYSSADDLMSRKDIERLLRENRLMVGDRLVEDGELLG